MATPYIRVSGKDFISGETYEVSDNAFFQYDLLADQYAATLQYLSPDGSINVFRAIISGNFTYGSNPSGSIARASLYHARIASDKTTETAQSFNFKDPISLTDWIAGYPNVILPDDASSVNYFYTNSPDTSVEQGRFTDVSVFRSRDSLSGLIDVNNFKDGWWQDPFNFSLASTDATYSLTASAVTINEPATYAPALVNPFGLIDIGYNSDLFIADFDADGDIDIFASFHEGFVFFENINTSGTLVPEFITHVGDPLGVALPSTLIGDWPKISFGDLDADGDLDLLAGFTNSEILFYRNIGTLSNPTFKLEGYQQSRGGYPVPPGNNLGLDITKAVNDVSGPGGFADPVLVDIDGDGDLDVFVGSARGSLYFFENDGSALRPHFSTPIKDPFNYAAVDYVNRASPSFNDFDGDGDLDLFIGVRNGAVSNGLLGDPFYYYQNIGSQFVPVFARPATNKFGVFLAPDDISNPGNLMYVTPTFNDYDADGDQDLWFGNNDGNFVLVENLSGHVQAVYPLITLDVSPVSVTEDGTTNLVYTLSRTGATTDALIVGYSIAGTADSSDYTGATAGTGKTITFAAGSATATLMIDPTADATVESDETVTLTLETGNGYTVGSTASRVGMIVNDEKIQSVSSSASTIRYQRDKDVTLPINYSTTDGSSTTGLAFKVHFNSSLFSFNPSTGVSNKLASAGLFEVGAVQQDTGDSDNDPTTDQYIPISIASFTGQLPSGSKLADLTFRSADKAIDPITGLRDTSINFSETSVASGYGFSGTSASLKPLSFNLDVDGDGLVTPLGDGLMVIRYLFGNAFAGDALINKAISPDSPLLGGKSYTSMSATEKAGVASLVATNIQQGIDSKLLDVDGDGKTTPLGDGLMVIRRLFGNAFAGSALTSKAISPESPYFSDPNAHLIVASNIDALKPTMPVV